LNFDNLKKLGVVLKRAKYFITCSGKYFNSATLFTDKFISTNLLYEERLAFPQFANQFKQLSLFV